MRGAWGWLIVLGLGACGNTASVHSTALSVQHPDVAADAAEVGAAPADVAKTAGGDRSLCDPCTKSEDCATPGAVCVALGQPAGAAGWFCEAPCSADGACAPGAVCDSASTADGASVPVCVPVSQACGCSAAAKAGGWTTPCFRVAYDATGLASGQCHGTWSCGDKGAVCDAPAPATETCDGVDNDCDGQTDEGAICDDGDPCTQADACVAGKCVPGKEVCSCHADADCPGVPCGDQAACDTSALPWHCATVPGTAVVCDAALSTACAVAACDAKTGACGLSPLADGKACDADGDPCSAGDHCQAGSCVAGAALPCSDGNPCTFDACDSKLGCTHTPVAGACDDGSACTSGDGCKGGACVGGTAKTCDDGNPCTADGCDSATGACTAAAGNEGAACADGDLCLTSKACSGGQCQGGSALACDDGNPCTTDSCNAKVGCVHAAAPGSCDDGNPCTSADACAGGACVGGANVCGCSANSDCAGKAAQNPCLGQFACNLGVTPHVCTVVAGTAVVCTASGPCLTAACDAKTGQCVQKAVAFGAPCEDGDACTLGDVCKSGSCLGNLSKCDDGNPCTQDACTAKLGCSHLALGGACDDGNPCTSGDACSGGNCTPGALIACSDGNACTADSCSAKSGGCIHSTSADGSVCQSGLGACGPASCAAGVCQPLASSPCDDGNPCTIDSCAAGVGCQHAPGSGPCDDLDACTSGDACGSGACQPGKAVNCDDGNVCTTDSCVAKSGCAHGNNKAACSDGDACSVGDACQGGVCLPGAPSPCDDGNACTLDACSGGVCKSDSAALSGKGCPPGAGCNGAATCSAGTCIDPPGSCPNQPGYEVWPPSVPATFGPAKTFYDPVGWHVVAFTIAPADWSAYLAQVAVQSQTGSYYPAECSIDGVAYGKVGIRPFGYGSQFYNPQKPNIRITFDHYLVDQTGPEKLHNLRLKASGQDRTWLRQPLSQTFVQQLGGNSPRWSWARVTLNGAPFGLYQLFEQVDKHMLKANFGNNDGEKYERNTTCWGLNCPPTGCADLAGKYDGDGDASEIVQLAQVCATGSAATWLAEAAKIVDVDALLADYAVEAVTADIDSMAAAGQNVTIYVNQDTGLLQVIPTGQDLDLGNSTAFYPLATPWGLPNSWCPGRIDNFYARLWSTPAAHDALMAKIQALHCGAMSNATLLPLIDAYHELLKQDLYFDPKGQATPAETDANFVKLKDFVKKRNAWLDGQVGACP